MKVLKTLDELDEMLVELDCAAAISDDELRKVFATFRMEFDTAVPDDPYSKEYLDHQFYLYRHIAGQSYSVTNESSQFDVEAATRSPFPYYTGSCDTVGNHMIAVGHAIRTLDLKPGASVLEFGPGWGNTTLALAMMGFDVTAVDIEANFCQLIRKRAAQAGIPVNVVNGDFSWIESIVDPVDAVLFFECFHHASDHLRLIKALAKATKDDGKVYFAAEPINADFPIPWGLRLDGESLWAIRKNGWLELGFNESYFVQMMMKHGWSIAKHSTDATPWGTVYVASKRVPQSIKLAASDPSIRIQAGERRNDGAITASGEPGYAFYGPYLTLPGDQYRLTMQGVATSSPEQPIVIDVVANGGQNVLAARQVASSPTGEDPQSTLCVLDFDLLFGAHDLEVRAWVPGGAKLSISGYTIESRV